MKRTTLALALGLSIVTPAMAQTIITTPRSTDGRGDVFLREYRAGGLIYNNFKYAKGVKDLVFNAHDPNAYRVIAGPNTSIGNKRTVLGDSHLRGDEVNQSTWLNRAGDVFKNSNLNHFVDLAGNSHPFALTIDYSNNPLMDGLLFFERGTGGSNSPVVLSAVDAQGRKIGKDFLVDPAQMIRNVNEAATYSQGESLHFSGSQTQSAKFLDIKRDFGVNSMAYLRITQPQLGVTYGNGLRFNGLLHGQDFQPDFKVIGTGQPVPEPATMTVLAMGALAAMRRRKKAA